MSRWQWTQLIGFEGFWLLAVVGQNAIAWLPVLLLVGHFVFTPSRAVDIRVLGLAAIGVSLDALLTLSGVFVFDQTPWWLLLLWMGFVMTLGHSMRWLSRLRWWQLMLIGAVAGPSSYIAGWRLGAVTLPLGVWLSLLVLILLWALLLPLLVRCDQRIRQRGS